VITLLHFHASPLHPPFRRTVARTLSSETSPRLIPKSVLHRCRCRCIDGGLGRDARRDVLKWHGSTSPRIPPPTIANLHQLQSDKRLYRRPAKCVDSSGQKSRRRLTVAVALQRSKPLPSRSLRPASPFDGGGRTVTMQRMSPGIV
jgi:hypothetical protein